MSFQRSALSNQLTKAGWWHFHRGQYHVSGWKL